MIGKKWNDTRLQNLQKTWGDCTNRRYRSQHFSLCFFACGAWRGQYRNGHSNRRACLERSGGREWSELCGVSPPHGERECLRGFAPARRDPFVSAKGSKTMGAQARPFGCLCHSPEWFGLRNSLRSNSPRPQRKFGTAAQPRLQAPWMALFSPFCHPRLDRGSRVFASSCLCEENDTGSSRAQG